jgi:hypothetical protein
MIDVLTWGVGGERFTTKLRVLCSSLMEIWVMLVYIADNFGVEIQVKAGAMSVNTGSRVSCTRDMGSLIQDWLRG